MTNLEIIRQACIKANPEINELKFGCELIDKNNQKAHIHGTDLVFASNGDFEFYFISYDETVDKIMLWDGENGIYEKEHYQKDYEVDFEVLGRPIRLSDVLLAIYKKDNANKTNVYLESDGQFVINGNFATKYWDLKNDNLELQSENTIKFLANLLVMEGK